ncbi:MAG: DUF4382 domain-containing protein [Halioglobus sp.]
MMSSRKKSLLLVLLLPVLLSLGGCPCGFDCSSDSDNDNSPASLSLGFSDASVEDLTQVVIEVDSISFRRSGEDDVVVDTFTIPDLDLVDADTFQIDLLEYRGRQQLLVIENLELPVGTYSSVRLTLVDGDLNFSFVEESGGEVKVLNGPASELILPGMALGSGDEHFTVEFSLAQAMRYITGSDTYLLSSEGVRVQDNATSASLTGRVESDLFDLGETCDAKTDPLVGNRVYLYEGTALPEGSLSDVHTSNSGNAVPDEVVAPFAVAALVENTLTGSWEYALGFLPAGDYTLALACDAGDDHPIDYDGTVVPLPTGQLYEIKLSSLEQANCDLAESASCN